MSEETYTIARMSERSGLSVPTLRFYESEGLIPPCRATTPTTVCTAGPR